MSPNDKQPKRRILALLISALILAASIQAVVAQDNNPVLTQTAEYDLGFDCPVATTLDPTGTTLWVLLDNCFESGFKLRAYTVADGTQLAVDDYADALMSLASIDNFVDASLYPLAFTPAGDLSIRYGDFQTAESFNTIIPLASGGEAFTQSSASYDAFLAQYSDYPEYSIYSPDHTRVVTDGATSFHVLDVQAETEIVGIPVEGGTDLAWAAFSADGERLEVTLYHDSVDANDHSSTLLIYSLPDGGLLKQYELPSSSFWLSPDQKYAAVNLFSNNIGDLNELVVINLETGLTSAALSLDEVPKPVTTCLNKASDVSDVGFMTDGRFSFPDLHWLADNSTIVLPLSYGGDGAEGLGSVCMFNYSRLRTYSVHAAG